MPGDVLRRISDTYYELTESEQRIAKYVIDNQTSVQDLSISELADLVRVSESTLSRFCRRLGFKSYGAFKLDLAITVAAKNQHLARPLDTADGCLAEAMEALTQTYKSLEMNKICLAAQKIFESQQVICMGQGASMVLAQECAHLFSLSRNNVRAVVDSHAQAIISAQLSAKDVVIYFSYSGATRELIENLRILRSQSVFTILITRFPKSPGAYYADLILRCMSYEGPLQGGSISARISQLFLLDVLFSEVEKLDPEAQEKRKMVGKILAEKHI